MKADDFLREAEEWQAAHDWAAEQEESPEERERSFREARELEFRLLGVIE